MGNNPFWIIDENGDRKLVQAVKIVPLDKFSGGLPAIDIEHLKTHQGKAYLLNYPISLNSAGTAIIRIETKETHIHTKVIISCTASLNVSIYEDSEYTDVLANRLTPFNKRRSSENTSEAIICHTPAGSNNGNHLITYYLGNDTGLGANKELLGDKAGGRGELNLKVNTVYAIIATSNSDNNRINIELDYYEDD